jgi:hypothetical protein
MNSRAYLLSAGLLLSAVTAASHALAQAPRSDESVTVERFVAADAEQDAKECSHQLASSLLAWLLNESRAHGYLFRAQPKIAEPKTGTETRVSVRRWQVERPQAVERGHRSDQEDQTHVRGSTPSADEASADPTTVGVQTEKAFAHWDQRARVFLSVLRTLCPRLDSQPEDGLAARPVTKLIEEFLNGPQITS